MFDCSKADSHMLPLLLPHVQILLEDAAVSVVKQCIRVASTLLRRTLVWITTAHTSSSDMDLCIIILISLKTRIAAMLDHENDGLVS